jgi:hypothetical protein
MGDKSPKAKKRGQQQKTAVKDQQAANATAKQDRQNRAAATPAAPKRGR